MIAVESSRMDAEQSNSLRKRNLRTGWIMASIALVGFLGIFARYWLFG